MIDLHIHTINSDGTDNIDELIEKISKSNIRYFSITDHDNIKSYYEIQSYLNNLQAQEIKYISGIEFSTNFENQSMHLLAYNYDNNIDTIESVLQKIKELRLNRINLHLEHLKNEHNIILNQNEIDWLYSQNNPSKPHIANILINKGYGNNVSEVIQKYLSKKYTNQKLDAIELVQKLSNQGIIIGIAHPLGGVGEPRITPEQCEYNIKTLKNHGINFIECFYSLYNEEERTLLQKIAEKYHIKLSGGSDYHGKNKDVNIGDLGKNYVTNLDDFTVLKIIK